MAEKSVRWTEPKKSNMIRSRAFASQGEHLTKGRKRYAIRDQPTWINCKLPRPPQYRIDDNSVQPTTTETLVQIQQPRVTTDLSNRILSPRRSPTPKSGSTRAVSTITSLSDVRSSRTQSSSSNSSILQDLVKSGENHKIDNNKGRDIFKKKVEELGLTIKYPVENEYHRNETTMIDNLENARKQTSALKKFRISSAESAHRSPDVSIGLRHIATLLRGQELESPRKPSQRRRSTSALLSLTKITSNNIQRTRRLSEPAINTTRSLEDIGTHTPAPGEGYLQQRRRSSVSAPATIGTESNSPSRGSNMRYQKTRPLPQACSSSPFADREWRPPTLQKFSVKPPWAPSQQTPRYFPKYANLQDIHLRNPYLVPGSILYKTPTIVE